MKTETTYITKEEDECNIVVLDARSYINDILKDCKVTEVLKNQFKQKCVDWSKELEFLLLESPQDTSDDDNMRIIFLIEVMKYGKEKILN